MRHLRFLFVALFTLPAFAQQPTPPAGLMIDSEASYSYSSDETFDHAGIPGSVAVHHFDFNALGRHHLSARDSITFGFSAAVTRLDASAGTFLPERLQAFALHLSGSRRLSEQWTATLTLRPGLYGDLEDIDSKTFNVPLLAAASYAVSRDLVWLFGLRVDAYAEHPAIPLAGVRWRFAPAWSLNLTYPRAGVQWRASDAVNLDLSATVQGGTFRITDSLGIPPGVTTGRLANTFLDYREIRVGLGGDFAVARNLWLRIDAGMFIDREFDYFDRAYTLETDRGTFATLALRSRF